MPNNLFDSVRDHPSAQNESPKYYNDKYFLQKYLTMFRFKNNSAFKEN